MGPLAGIRVVELAGIGPAPFCCMLLADLGAEVVRIDRIGEDGTGDPRLNPLNRNRRSVAMDLKHPEAVATLLRLVASADVLVEGFRPGVAERLGLGPEDCRRINPGLVYGRMSGWGQDGPLAHMAGHDINFLSLSGLLNAIGSADGPPVPPLNIIGDFAGGGLYLAFGILAALLERKASGQGQVVDAAMIDGVASLMTSLAGFVARGDWQDGRGRNLLDGGAPWYAVYETADGKYLSIASIEPKFYREMVGCLGLDIAALPDRADRANWDTLRDIFAAAIRTRTRADWSEVFAAHDICATPILDYAEAQSHPHLAAREVFTTFEGVRQPSPAPRFSRTAATLRRPPPRPGEHTREILAEWGLEEAEIRRLCEAGAARQA